ncbi:MAG: serine/threonine-protein kinase [Gemmataceae bacterium]
MTGPATIPHVDLTAASGNSPPPAGAASGEVIAGRYRLVRPLGEGGMGAVFLAEQTDPVKRPVAVKLIRAGKESPAIAARFEAERQALALMQHPHIARVFDGGVTVDGRPFFVMEYVDGRPLTDFCRDRGLSLRAKLDLFLQVCDAVRHAHQKGVIHRDLKPGNVLVAEGDGRASPKVIDFGIAKATAGKLSADALTTAAGAVLGTPAYMAPEQAGNAEDADTRTDGYALGVLLYELLTGTTPIEAERLKATPVYDLLELIKDEEAEPPSRRMVRLGDTATARQLRRELDWIALKALAKERDRRYESVAGLAEDVRRFLADKPVQAGPPSQWYRVRKWGWRNRVGVAGLALIAAVMFAVGWAAIERRRATGLSESYRNYAEIQEAVLNQSGTSDGLWVLNEWLDGTLCERHGMPPPFGRPPAEQSVPVSVLVAEYSQRARLQAIRPAASLTSTGRITEMNLQRKTAAVLGRLDRCPEAIVHTRRVVELADCVIATTTDELHRGDADERAATRKLLDTMTESRLVDVAVLAEYLARTGELDEAAQQFDTATAAAERLKLRPWSERGAEFTWQSARTCLALGRPDDANRHLASVYDHYKDNTFTSSPKANEVLVLLARYGQPADLVKWRGEFAAQGWVPDLAPPPRPVGR